MSLRIWGSSNIPAFNFSIVKTQKRLAQISKAFTIPVWSFGELFHQTKLDVQWWEEYHFSVHQKVVLDILRSVRDQFLPYRPVLLLVMLRSIPTILHAQKAWVYLDCRPKKIHHLQVYTNQPLMPIITNFLQHVLHRFLLLIQCSRVSKGYRSILEVIVQQYTFQWSLATVNELSPIFAFILSHSKLV